jgi:hypothetical protein
LNDFGRAFRDNGYQLLQGRDNPTKSPASYFPLSIRLTPHYEVDTISHQETDQGTTTLKTGGVADIGLDLLAGGTLHDNVSFLVVPTGFTSGDGVTLESAWVRFSNIGGSSWFNLKLGKHDLDLPRSGHRRWDMAGDGYLIYGYHSPGSVTVFDMGENERGVEWMGHDRGSRTRIAASFFSVEGSPGSRGAFNTPGFYAHTTHEWHFSGNAISAFRIGGFGSYSTWPTTILTEGGEPIPGQGGDLKASSKAGFDSGLWFGPMETPLHLTVAMAHGQDNKDLIVGADRNGTFNGGFLELGFTPRLKTTIFGRYDVIRNHTQGVSANAQNLNDEDAETVGIRHTFNFTSRDEYALHSEFSSKRAKLAATDGSDVRNNSFVIGVDFAF